MVERYRKSILYNLAGIFFFKKKKRGVIRLHHIWKRGSFVPCCSRGFGWVEKFVRLKLRSKEERRKLLIRFDSGSEKIKK